MSCTNTQCTAWHSTALHSIQNGTGQSSLTATHIGKRQQAVGHSVVTLDRGRSRLPPTHLLTPSRHPCMDRWLPPLQAWKPPFLRAWSAPSTSTYSACVHCVCCAVATAMVPASGSTPRWGLCAWSMPGMTNAAHASMLRSAMTDAHGVDWQR